MDMNLDMDIDINTDMDLDTDNKREPPIMICIKYQIALRSVLLLPLKFVSSWFRWEVSHLSEPPLWLPRVYRSGLEI